MMMRSSLALVLVALVSGVGSAAQDSKKPKGKEASSKDLRLPLNKVAIKKGTQRMGWGLKGEPPVEAWQAKFQKLPGTTAPPFPEILYLYDLDGSGTIEPETDGIAFPVVPFIVPLPKVLLLKLGQYKLSVESMKTLVLSPEDLGPAQKYVADAAVFTEFRVRSGLTPVPLDKDLCIAAEKHCEYLKANSMTDGKAGSAVYSEEKGKPGYSEEGLDVAKVCTMGFNGDSVARFLQENYASLYRRAPMVNPRLSCFGVAGLYGMSLLHVAKQDGIQDSICLSPPDGATGVPRFFTSNGEAPTPVPGSDFAKGCGFPILIRVVQPYNELVSAEVVDPKGRKVIGTISSPAKPANKDWANNNGCAAFIPSKSLDSNTTYQVSFQFAEEKDSIKWSFTTAEK